MTSVIAIASLLDCGHPSTPDRFTSGYAVTPDRRTLCYECAADRDKDRARTMTPADEPLFAYIRAERMPAPYSNGNVLITTWAGVVLGRALLVRGARSDNQMRVIATIEGRQFWGRTPTHNGTYTRLRPYRDQDRKY